MASKDIECPICFETFNDNIKRVNSCVKHFICYDCRHKIEESIKIQNKCPLCRDNFTKINKFINNDHTCNQDIYRLLQYPITTSFRPINNDYTVNQDIYRLSQYPITTSFRPIKSISERIKSKQ